MTAAARLPYRVSVAMATYNGATYVSAQLESLQTQVRSPDELVICDDGSTDGTLGLLEAFREQVGFEVSIHRNPARLGYVRNFERALSLCSGAIVFPCDQDDVWFETKIATMCRVLESDPDLQVLIADMVIADEELRPSRYTQLGNILDIGMPEASYVAGCATAVRRTWLELALPIPDAGTSHDTWIHRLALALSVRRVLPEPLQLYRRHGANASASIASRPQKMTALRAWRQHGLDSALQGWREEFARTRAVRARIADSGPLLARMGLAGNRARALLELDAYTQALDRRIDACSRGRVARLPRLARMWLRADYRFFSGLRSALKDLLRP